MEVLPAMPPVLSHQDVPASEPLLPPSPAQSVKEVSAAGGQDGGDGGSNGGGERLYPMPPKARTNKVLPEDIKTPDNHVERDPRLIRLTGIHPFNVEAPLSDLYDEGFITTKDLHYVRNHGAVPKVEDSEIESWEFTVEGMVEKPFTLTVGDLMRSYEQITYPVTLVCAGNRRKEQNVVRKSKGFSWGPAGLSTALWTGVALSDLIAKAVPRRGAKYVCFEGADKLPNGYYATSIKLNWVMDPNKGVTVCHKMNGETLHPDHGKPVRIIIPGQIGGRSVKWLKKIVVTPEPSDNWYHIYDNRVLPTMITPEASADLPETWKDERYAIYDLNTNSATAYPAHDEVLPLAGTEGRSYTVRGYAYGGGGRRVTRMELTLDKGKTWSLADITYPEDTYRDAPEGDTLYGGKVDMFWRETSFCWCFWEIKVPIDDLRGADDVMIRAMDEGLHVQPRDMYWSVLGMMNNPWYRVVIHKEGDSLRFEHPTQPALIPGGWMERVKKAGGNITNGFWGERVPGEEEQAVAAEPEKEICMTNPKVDRIITLDELKQHSGEEEPWFVVKGEVYDGTPYLDAHPGGAVSIFGAAGQDATEEFVTIHSENAKAMMPEYHIGTLDEESRKLLSAQDDGETDSDKDRAVFLQSKMWSRAVLREKTKVSPDSKVFTFDLHHADQTIGLPVGQHLMMRLRDSKTNDAIIRAYTPISEGHDRGKLDILIKIYFDSAERQGGKMTQALDAVPIGESVEFKGPVGKFEYMGKGVCSISGKERLVRRFIMVCAGSGVTPIFQVLRAVMKDREDPTNCLVLDGNRVEDDILCRTELDSMVADNEGKCKILYSLTRPEASWTGLKGRMDKDMFEREVGRCQQPGGDEVVLVCGPPSMEDSVRSIFGELGWGDDLIFF